MRLIAQIVNEIWYLWKRNNWMLDPRSWFGKFDGVPIDRPIFLLGVQGEGVTGFLVALEYPRRAN